MAAVDAAGRREAARCPGTRIVFVADSEADIYDVIAEGMEGPRTADWIIRSCQDRALVDDLWEDRIGLDYLREELLAAPVLERRTITVRGRTAKVACEDRGRRQPRQSREAVVEVRAVAGHAPRPGADGRAIGRCHGQRRAGHRGGPARGGVAVEWLLLTSLPIDTVDQVRLVIQYYRLDG